MDWENERYIRIYTRDTVEWEMLPWQSRALWPNLLRKCDRRGHLPLGKYGVRGLANLVKLPLEVVEPGLAGLLDDGCLVQEGELLRVPNFRPAQEAKKSDRQRKEEQRERERLDEIERHAPESVGAGGHKSSREVTNRDAESQSVTESHNGSRAVTESHGLSRNVTPSLAEPSLAEPSLAEPSLEPPLPPTASPQGDAPAPVVEIREARKRAKAKAKGPKPKPTPSPDGVRVLVRMAELSGCGYGFSRALEERLAEGVPVEDCLAVVEHLGRDPWWRDHKFRNEQAPFRQDKFPGYLAQARAGAPPGQQHRTAGIATQHPEARAANDAEMRRCARCHEYAQHRWTDDGWATDHECAARAAP